MYSNVETIGLICAVAYKPLTKQMSLLLSPSTENVSQKLDLNAILSCNAIGWNSQNYFLWRKTKLEACDSAV